MLTRKRPVNRTVSNVAYAEEKELDPAKCEDLMKRAEKGLDEAAVLNRLRKPFAGADFMFLKYKLELILRANGKGTPKQSSDAGFRYSTLEQPVYDTGYRSGVQDSQIQFGAPVVTLEIPRKREETNAATIGEVLAALLDFYQQHAYYSYGGLDQIRETAQAYIKNLDIRCFGPTQHSGTLSGGNQQKVCIAKALCMSPKFLFVSEPTRGIDIGAKKLVLETLVRLNRELGMTVVIVSSELQELKSVSDRIAIVSEGKLVDILSPQASDADYGLAMSGIKPSEHTEKGGTEE